MVYNVTVEKMLHVSGTIKVKAASEAQALKIIKEIMDDPQMRPYDGRIEWDDPRYEDGTFCVTGDVEEA
jgi:hypothetical protein